MDNNIDKSKKQDLKINIIVDPETGQGKFSNMANLSHSNEEFTLDFIYINPSPPPFGKMVSRIVMTPGHCKRFYRALQENIEKFERKFGEINIGERPKLDKKNIN
jgi:hypothetical protein